MSELLAEFFIPGEFTTLNDYSDSERAHWTKGAKIKKQETDRVFYELMSQRPIRDYPVKIEFFWRCKDKKHDPDNICFAKKYILDGMKNAGIIENDGWAQIAGFSDEFEVSKDVGVVIRIFSHA